MKSAKCIVFMCLTESRRVGHGLWYLINLLQGPLSYSWGSFLLVKPPKKPSLVVIGFTTLLDVRGKRVQIGRNAQLGINQLKGQN